MQGGALAGLNCPVVSSVTCNGEKVIQCSTQAEEALLTRKSSRHHQRMMTSSKGIKEHSPKSDRGHRGCLADSATVWPD